MTTKNDEIVAIEGWGVARGAPEVVRFLAGPQRRLEELMRAARIFCEFIRGFRALHFVGPCVTVFVRRALPRIIPITTWRGSAAPNSQKPGSQS
jgi:hypothetical protein